MVGSDKGATTFKNDKLVAYATAVYEVKDGDLIPQNGYGNLTQDQKAALNDIGVRTDVTSGDLIAPITAPNSNVVKTAVVDSDAAVKAATGSGFEYNSTATCAQNALNCGLALANDPEYTNIRYATVVVGNDGVAVGHAVILADVNDLETGKTKTIVVDPKGTIFEIGKNVEINAAEQAIPVEKGGLAATIKLADTALTVETPITETESKDVRDASAESDSGSTPDATAAVSSSADAATAAADTSTGVGKPADDIVTEVMGSGEKTAGGQIVSSEGDAPGVASDPAAPQAQARQTASLEGSVVDKTFVSPVLPEESAQSTPLDKPDDKPAAPLGSPTPGPEVPSHGGTNNFEKQDAAANDQNFVTNPKAFNPLDNLGGSSTSETPSTDNKSLPKIDMNSLAAFNPNNPTPPPLPRLTVFACEGISAACSVEEIRDGSLNKALVQSGEMLEQLATLVADQNTAKDRGEIEKVIRLESEIQTKQEEIANLRDQISSTWSQVSGLVDNSYQGMTYANSANLINGALNKITDTHNAIIAGESFDSETIANLKSSDNYSSFAANYSSFMTEAPLSPGAGSILADVSGDYFQNPVRIAQNGSNSSFSSTPPRSRNDDPTANLRDP
ncbi:MAG: hypothetical protein COV44_06875 [Deltaproteobacteria bacterium CG11_big_fil_rev_8_21_14_0_20_45_16]|nr:MAG: hypothetical protein COV44_06875 [Deltaproteobacteria bacterium CG11_big_fil_rev_8_21_14_0_20_45_16]